MKKRGFRIFLLIVLVLAIFSVFVNASVAPTGVCYTTLPGNPCARSSSCEPYGTFGKLFVNQDVYDECIDSLGCCCYGGIEGALLSSEICSADYITNFDTFTSEITDQTQCQFYCRGETPPCSYTTCEAPNTIFPCSCGGTEINSGTPYCCGSDSAYYPTQNACLSTDGACKVVTYSISGTITDQDNQPLSGVTVSTLGSEFVTSSNGNFQLSSLQPGSYTVIAFKTGYDTNTTLVEVVNSNILSVNLKLTLKPEEFDSDNDGVNDFLDICPYESSIQYVTDPEYREQESVGFCLDNIDNDCDRNTDCDDTSCISSDPSCQTSYCGDNIVQQPNTNGLVEECDGTADSNCPGLCQQIGQSNPCRCLPMCGDNIKQELEQCDVVDGVTLGCPDSSLGCGTDCTCLPSNVCGDHVISGKEECDFNLFGQGFDSQGFFVNCILPGSSLGEECTILRSECDNGVLETPFEDCEIGALGGRCSDAECNVCTCPVTCFDEQDAPVIDSVSLTLESYDISLSWDSNCVPDSYSVYRCSGSGTCTVSGALTLVESTLDTSYIDNYTKTENTRYCYLVKAFYSNIRGEPAELVSAPVCVFSGDDECSKPTTNEFCDGEVRSKCDADNKIVPVTVVMQSQGPDCSAIPTVSGESYICTGPDANENTYCLYQSNCDECNDVLGMFYRDGFSTYLGVPTQCSSILTCYVDYSETSVDKYYSCSDVDSCYDYRSKDACELDKCLTNGCEWVQSQFNELGYGVCRPIDTQEQDCSKCMEPYNSVFGECNKEACSLYGECYFDKVGSSYVCKSALNLACEDYDSSEDCTGGQNVNTDVSYQYSNDLVECQVSGYQFALPCKTNKILGSNLVTKSNDLFGIGLCKWVESGTGSYCLKDADNKDNYHPLVGDCLPGDSICRTDYEPPLTNIEIPPITGKNSYLKVSKIDNVYESEDISTYFTVVPTGVTEYPKTLSNGDYIYLGDSSNITSSRYYTVYYFSQDGSFNLETIKSFDIFIDAVAPTVSLGINKQSALSLWQSQKVYLTNLTISLDVTDDVYEESTCTVNLTGGSLGSQGLWLNNEVGTSWSKTYYDLLDGTYILRYKCVDKVGNVVYNQTTILLDEDQSITNPLPYGPINYDGNVVINVRTSEDAECRYSLNEVPLGVFMDDNTFNSMELFTVTQQKVHSKPVSLSVEDGTNLPVKYYVRCKFPDGSYRGTDSDNIRFVIDKEPPLVWLEVNNEETELDSWFVTSPVNVKIKCLDPEVYIDDEIMSYDNCKIHFCSGTTCQLVNTGNPIYTLTGSASNQEVEVAFKYQAKDAGANPSQIYSKVLKIDRIPPRFDMFIKNSFNKTLDVVTLGRYFVYVFPTEPLSEIISFDFEFLGSVFDVTPFGIVSEVDNIWKGFLDIDERFLDVESNATFRIYAKDHHGLSGSVITSGINFMIDTKAPEAPLIEPTLDTIMHLIDGIYYTNQDSIFISGSTSEYPINITFKKDSELIHSYKQAINNKVDELKASSGSLGQNVVYFAFDVRNNISSGDYLEFNHYRTDYPKYKQYYKVESVTFSSIQSEVRLDVPLQDNVPLNQIVKVYKNPIPSNWFTQDTRLVDYVQLPLQGEIPISTSIVNLSINAVDDAGNPSPSVDFNIKWDKTNPTLVDYYPKDGWVVNYLNTQISSLVSELITGSGLDQSTLNFKVDDSIINYDKIVTADNDYKYTNFIYNKDGVYVLSEGEHNVYLEVYDNAGNLLSDTWTFEINQNVPSVPDFYIDNATLYNGVWNTNVLPNKFYLTFKELVRNVTTSIGECDSVDRINFECNISESEVSADGTFRIFVDARKLDKDDYGHWWFEFSLDREEPMSYLYADNNARSNTTIKIEAYSSNEEYPTSAYLDIFGETYVMPLVFFNYHSYQLLVPDMPDGEYPYNVTISDRAGNVKVLEGILLIDNTPPDLGIIDIIADNLYTKIIDGEIVYYTSDPYITIIGNASDLSVVKQFHSFFGDISFGTVDLDAQTYTLDLILERFSGEEFENIVLIKALDESGNENIIQLRFFVDLRPPEKPVIIVSETDSYP